MIPPEYCEATPARCGLTCGPNPSIYVFSRAIWAARRKRMPTFRAVGSSGLLSSSIFSISYRGSGTPSCEMWLPTADMLARWPAQHIKRLPWPHLSGGTFIQKLCIMCKQESIFDIGCGRFCVPAPLTSVTPPAAKFPGANRVGSFTL